VTGIFDDFLWVALSAGDLGSLLQEEVHEPRALQSVLLMMAAAQASTVERELGREE